MSGAINNLKNNIGNFVSALKAHKIDVNLGLIYYGDQSNMSPQSNPWGDKVPATNLGFPLNVDNFKSKVDRMPLSGGGDGPESGLEGIALANTLKDFRSDATKNFILITDAKVHEALPDGFDDINGNGTQDVGESNKYDTKYSNYTVDGVIKSLLDNKVKLTVIGPNYNPTKTQLNQLSSSTKGSYLDIYGSYSEQLLNLAEQITNESGGEFTEESMKPVIIQTGANEEQQVKIPLYDLRDFRILLKDMALTPYSAAMDALGRVDHLIAKISSRRAEYGGLSNRLEHAFNNVKITEENLIKAESTLRDADIAKETLKLNKDRILLQSSQSMMTQINQMSQEILKILN